MKLVRLIRMCLNETCSEIRIDEDLSDNLQSCCVFITVYNFLV
jgi:hypothetical protein